VPTGSVRRRASPSLRIPTKSSFRRLGSCILLALAVLPSTSSASLALVSAFDDARFRFSLEPILATKAPVNCMQLQLQELSLAGVLVLVVVVRQSQSNESDSVCRLPVSHSLDKVASDRYH
jgi:hypothetical protein